MFPTKNLNALNQESQTKEVLYRSRVMFREDSPSRLILNEF